MSSEAIKFKAENPNMNFSKMTVGELSKLPPHNGILNFKITNTSFLILNILNDDSSAIKFFWNNTHDRESLDIWYDICKEEGTYIDVGAHTGLYTLTTMKSNKNNNIIAFEPYFLNMARLITNLRINGINENVTTMLSAASNADGKTNFNIKTDGSYLSKGGKISDNGFEVDIHKLDTLFYNNLTKPLNGIKIDTEGEDYNVLLGASKLIKSHKPKIIIEVRDENKISINTFLSKYNYKFFDVNNLSEQVFLEKYNIKNIANILAKPF